MADTSSDILVVGAGAFGLATALGLARAGLCVRVVDRPSEGAPNASAVAAGMLAPFSETLLEGAGREYLAALLTARDLWASFSKSVRGLSLDRSGVDLLAADSSALDDIIARLSAWGLKPPPLAPPRLGVHLAEDWRIDPIAAIAALRAALADLGVLIEAGAVKVDDAETQGLRGLSLNGKPLRAGRVVIAAGYQARDLAPAAPELTALSPIKGQLLAFSPGAAVGPSVRAQAIYLVPQPSGARAGATMEPGRDDSVVDGGVTARLHEAALAIQPSLAGQAYRAEAGVRAATPDGWPLVGASVAPGVFLATGARRNGWLLAPLVSQMIVDAITGAPPHPLSQAFHPGRFTR